MGSRIIKFCERKVRAAGNIDGGVGPDALAGFNAGQFQCGLRLGFLRGSVPAFEDGVVVAFGNAAGQRFPVERVLLPRRFLGFPPLG